MRESPYGDLISQIERINYFLLIQQKNNKYTVKAL